MHRFYSILVPKEEVQAYVDVFDLFLVKSLQAMKRDGVGMRTFWATYGEVATCADGVASRPPATTASYVSMRTVHEPTRQKPSAAVM